MRVMRVLTRPNLGGPTRQAIALWHAHRRLDTPTLLVTGAVDQDEAALAPSDHGVPALTYAEALAAGPAACGWVELPDLGRRASWFADRRAARALAGLLAAHRPEVVHTHTSKAGWLGRRAAFAAGVPVVAHTFHGHVLRDYFAAPFAWWLTRLERRLAAATTLLFAVSASCADELAAARVAPRARFTVMPPAVPLVPPAARAVARQRLGIAAEERVAVCIGRLVPIKRVEHFVDAVAAVPGLRGDVVGDGPERGALAALAAVRTGAVRLLGAVPDIAALMPAYDVLVLPSVREGLPLVAVEAARGGVPVVGYDVPGVRDAREFAAGELVPPAQGARGLAAAIERTLAAPAPAPRAIEACDPATIAANLLRAYRGAAAGSRSLP